MGLPLKQFQAGLTTVAIITLFHGVYGTNQKVVPSCDKDAEVCEFYWTVDYIYSMIRFNNETGRGEPIVIRNGTFYKRTVNFSNKCNTFVKLTDDEKRKVPFVDGRYTLLYGINYTYPGPNIVVHEGQTVVVHVTNSLINEAITIHWHGLYQRGTPYMDGVPKVTQCPINPNEKFTYRFKADTPGTHWYHSHFGLTRTDGLYGAIVVLPRERRNDIPKVKGDYLMLVQDFYHEYPSLQTTIMQKWFLLFNMDGFASDKCTLMERGIEGTSITLNRYDSAVINGKGHKFDEKTGKPTTPEIPLEDFIVKPNEVYRFRIINTGMTNPFRISFDEHPLTVVATDGNDIKPIEVESVIVHNGERFDVLIHTKQSKSRFWIRAETLAIKEKDGTTLRHPWYTHAILTYEGAPYDRVVSSRDTCTEEKPCRVLNCHYGQDSPDASNLHQHCLDISDMEATDADVDNYPLPMPSQGDDIEELFLNFHLGDLYRNRPMINGKAYATAPVPYLLQQLGQPYRDIEASPCSRKDCATECQCQHVVKVKKEQILQIILDNNDGHPQGMSHPIHLHGQSFHVLKVAYPSYDPDTGNVQDINPDIDFSELYTESQWANSSWFGNNIPGLNLQNPPRKDMITIPRKGYVVVRFRADNPGFWFIHCHLETHLSLGMAMVLQVGELSDLPPIPEGFPICGPYRSSTDHDDGHHPEDRNVTHRGENMDADHLLLASQGNPDGANMVIKTGHECVTSYVNMYVFVVVLVVIVLAELFVIIYLKYKNTIHRRYPWPVIDNSYRNERCSLMVDDKVPCYSGKNALPN